MYGKYFKHSNTFVGYQVFNLKTILSNDDKETHCAFFYHFQTPLFLYVWYQTYVDRFQPRYRRDFMKFN